MVRNARSDRLAAEQGLIAMFLNIAEIALLLVIA
jgi:hypothetical protein